MSSDSGWFFSGARLPPATRRNTRRQQGVDSGNYNIQQTIEFGYRADWINGNNETYDTFVNLGQGVRLFDYTLEMRSSDHRGPAVRQSQLQQFRLWRRSERCLAPAHRQEQVV